MKLQTERIDNHRAQFTIEIEAERLDEAKRQAARKISRQVRIRGFRKGRAPYRLVAQHVGEAAILEEALDALGDVLYKQAMVEADVSPYGPGAFEDFQPEPSPTFVFTVPLEPEVDLKDYLEVRAEYEEPQVSAQDIEDALKQLQLRAIEVIDDEVKFTKAGHRVTISVDSEFLDGEPPEEPSDAPEPDALTGGNDAEEAPAEDAPYIPKKGDTFVKDENAVIILDPNEDPFTHGFVENLVDAELGSDIVFELTIPDDDADETIIGRRVEFVVTIKQIEEIAIPELDDEFARIACRNRGDEETDLAGLRESTRVELLRSAERNTLSEYSGVVLQQIIDGAEIAYPDVALEERLDEILADLERNLAQNHLKLEEYYRLTNTSEADLRERHREEASQLLRQSLVLREIARAHELEVSEAQIEERIDAFAAGYGSSPEIRKLFATPQMRDNLRNELLISHLNELLVAIGRGQAPGEALELMRQRIADEAEKARLRSERLRRYQAEDESEAEAARVEESDDAPPAEPSQSAEAAASENA